jgi:hypothetical protein
MVELSAWSLKLALTAQLHFGSATLQGLRGIGSISIALTPEAAKAA